MLIVSEIMQHSPTRTYVTTPQEFINEGRQLLLISLVISIEIIYNVL